MARTQAFIDALRARVRGEVRAEEPLARYSTYRIGGPATVVLPQSSDDVAAAVEFAREQGIPWFAVGLGSNLLFPDEGLTALVIRIGKGLDRLERDGDRWRIGAGLPGPLAARKTVAEGFGGLQKFVGIPGSVGGGVYMNAGAHGGEWAEVIESVRVLAADGRDRTLARQEIPFAYRRSGLGRVIVLETAVRLHEEDPARLRAEIDHLFKWRSEGTPFNQPCCGSVFQNPGGPSWGKQEGPKTAGQLIEAAGLKGHRIGGAEVSPMHANYFVNTGNASAADVRALIDHARQRVQAQFGVRLETEVKLIAPDGSTLPPV
ncbi:MAG: UDP-N-acetylmuramate dehydrogenase [Gemmatimonadetes bacterium]|nr:UDP-N-acetylmuramate dehydrogenase [Gemmatimonadota bacterium]